MSLAKGLNIVVIALERETQRRAAISHNLSQLSAPFSFINAPDFRAHPELKDHQGYNAAKAHQLIQRPLSDAEISCFAAHRSAWLQAAESRHCTIVLESDAQIDQQTLDICEQLSRFEDWELVMLNYHKCTPSFWQRRALIHDRQRVKFANPRVYCSASYLLSPSGARKLCAHSEEVFLPSDDFMTGGHIPKDLTLHAVYPPCAGFNAFAADSNIQHKRDSARKTQRTQQQTHGLAKRAEQRFRILKRQIMPPRKGL